MKSMMNPETEKLTDNTKIHYCKQCEDCINWNPDGSPFSNKYDKAYCEIFQYPNAKPPWIINNEDDCEYRIEKIRS